MKHSFSQICVSLAAAALALTSCFSPSKPKTSYLLTPRASDEAAPYLRVGDSFHGSGTFTMPRYVDGSTMSVRVNGNQVISLAGAHWATPIGEMIRSTLAQNLALLAGESSHGQPVAKASQFHFTRFDGEDAKRFVVQGTCLLTKGTVSRTVFFKYTLPWNGSAATLVECSDEALLAIARQLVQETKNLDK